MNTNRKVVVLPVRSGSQRIKNKNFRKFCESSLFRIKLDQLLRLEFIDELMPHQIPKIYPTYMN